MSTKVSTGFGWLEDDTTGDPAGVRRHSDGKEFTIPLVETDPVTGRIEIAVNGNSARYGQNIMLHGAKGDGVTDDTLAIKRAIVAAAGGAVYFPKGIFVVSDTIEINTSGTTLYGDGPASVIRLVDGTGSITARAGVACNVRRYYASAEDRIHNVTVRDLCVDQSSVTAAYVEEELSRRVGYGAITARFVDNISVRNVMVKSAIGNGISIVGCYDQNVTDNTIDGLRVLSAGPGVVRGGNGIEIVAKLDGEETVYAGPMGCARVIGNNVNGASGQWPSAVVGGMFSTCNIGIVAQVGALNPISRQQKSSIVTGNTVSRCMYGIVSEGQNTGGTGDIIISSNDVRETVYGINMFGNAGQVISTTDNSFSAVISANRISSTYAVPISVFGNGVAITGNVVTDWGIADDAAVFGQFGISEAIGVFARPFADGNVSALTATGLLISGNVLQNRFSADNLNVFPVSGVCVATLQKDQTWYGVVVTGNFIDCGKATKSGSGRDGGIILVGRVDGAVVSTNSITGTSDSPVSIHPAYGESSLSSAAENVQISENMIKDNGYRNTDGFAIVVNSSRSGYYIDGNKIIETSGNRMSNAVYFAKDAGTDSAATDIYIRRNVVKGMSYGDEYVFSLNVTGNNVVISDNDPYNRRGNAPDSVNYRNFAGTIIYKKTPVSGGHIGWACTSTGSPGAWSSFGTLS